MDNRIWIGVLVVGILLVGGFLFSGSGAVVSAQGESTIEVEPDEVSVYLNIEAKGDSAQLVKDELDIMADDVLVELLKIGLERKDIQIVNYNIYPEYNYNRGEREQNGFIARQDIVVKTDDFDLVPGIVDGAVSGGALIGSINFELSEERQREFKIEALEAAGRDAESKAEATAAGLGKKLGRLVRVSSQDYNYWPVAYYESASSIGGVDEAREAALNIVPRDIEVRASVSVEYKLGF